MFVGWIFVAVAACLIPGIYSQFSDNTPPIMWLDRNWVLPDSEPVGSIITRVRAEDNEQDELTYGLEPLGHNYNGDESSQAPLPFSINNQTGTIFLNDTLKGRGGENLFLYVTVSDGQLTAKTEVYVNIKNTSAPNGGHTRSPFPSQHGSGGRIRPPLLALPNIPTYPRPQILPKISPGINNEDKTTRLRPESNKPMDNHKISTTAVPNKLEVENGFETNHIDQETTVVSAKTSAPSEAPATQDIAMTLVPVVAVCALLMSIGTGIWSFRGKFCGPPKAKEDTFHLTDCIFALILGSHQELRSEIQTLTTSTQLFQFLVSILGILPLAIVWIVRIYFQKNFYRIFSSRKKEQASVRVSNISDDPSLILKSWQSPKFRNSKLKDWDNDHQVCDKKHQDDHWEFPRHRLKVFSILGEGCFGQVWKSEALDIDGKTGPTIVAVKTLKENATERERLDLSQELKVMKGLEPHPNVVRLLGCCTEREPMFVILEYVSGGKLQSFLRASREERNHGGPGLTSRDLTGFVYQVAKGMEYLASKGIIHRDLAARNVLIDENRACKVADFGFARDVAANQIYERKSEGRLPIRWMAPESLYDNIFSVKSDIWSFGVLIWEIVTLGSTPYPGMAAAEVMRRIKEGYRLDRPEHCKRELYNIMYYCWDKDASCRPSFSELVSLAEGLLLDETDYIELDRFPDHSYYNLLNLSGEKL